MNDHIKTAAEISSILKPRFELAADVQVIHPNSEKWRCEAIAVSP